MRIVPISLAALLVVFLMSPGSAADAADAADRGTPEAKIPEPIALQRFTLADGRMLVGAYDDDSGQLTLHDEKTGKRIAQFAVAAADITRREPVEIQPPSAASLPQGANGNWITNYGKAKELATELNRPILINFTGSDWCGWCVKLDKEVFTQKAFKDWAAAKVILVKIDFPRRKPLPEATQQANNELAQSFAVTGYPTVHIVDAKTGASLRKWGYIEGGPQAWVEKMIQGVPALNKLAWKH